MLDEIERAHHACTDIAVLQSFQQQHLPSGVLRYNTLVHVLRERESDPVSVVQDQLPEHAEQCVQWHSDKRCDCAGVEYRFLPFLSVLVVSLGGVVHGAKARTGGFVQDGTEELELSLD